MFPFTDVWVMLYNSLGSKLIDAQAGRTNSGLASLYG